jgi:hypothetical protein
MGKDRARDPFEKPRNAETLVLVFRRMPSPYGAERIKLVWMGPRNEMEKGLRHRLESDSPAKSLKKLYGIDYRELTRFEVSVTKNKRGYQFSTLYLTKPKSKIERELRELATLPPSEEQSGS